MSVEYSGNVVVAGDADKVYNINIPPLFTGLAINAIGYYILKNKLD